MSRRGPWDPRRAPHLSNPAAKRHKSAAALADSGRLLHMLYVLLQIITPSIYVPRDAMQRDVLGSEWGGRGCPCVGQLFNKTAEFQHQWLMMPHMHSLCNLLMQKESKSFCKGLKTKYWCSVSILSTHIWHLSDCFALLLRSSVTASPPRRASTCDTFNSWQISYNLQLFPLF